MAQKRRPWRGHPIDFVRAALTWGQPELRERSASAASEFLRHQWREALHALRFEHRDSDRLRRRRFVAWSDSRWNRLNECTPVLIKSPRQTFCERSWGCPDCYGRKLWELYNQLQDLQDMPGGFQLLTEEQFPEMGTWTPSPLLFEEAEEVWVEVMRDQARIVERNRNVIHWRWIAPRWEYWSLRSVWIVPGDQTLEELTDSLVEALHYPHDFFRADPVWVAYCLRFMEGKRGRSVTGAWSRR